MNDKLVIVEEFSPRPYGRYPSDGDYCGEIFRKELLAPRLRRCVQQGNVLEVILDGYNRYGRSFLDEAFGGLIREEGFTYETVKKHLIYRHSLVESIEMLIKERIEAAAKAVQNL